MRWIAAVVLMVLALVPARHLLAEGAELQVLSPMPGETVIGNTVGVYFAAHGLNIVPTVVKVEEAGMRPEVNRQGEGHVHLMLDLQPMIIWESADPYTFDAVPVGDHVLTVELVQNDHSSFTPPLVEQIRFTSVAATTPAQPTVLTLPNTGIRGSAYGASTVVLLMVSVSLIIVGARLRRRSHS